MIFRYFEALGGWYWVGLAWLGLAGFGLAWLGLGDTMLRLGSLVLLGISGMAVGRAWD